MSTVIKKAECLEIVAHNVERLMEKRGWSLRELARQSENEPMAISRLIRKIHMPSVDCLVRISEACNVRIDKLFEET